MTARICLSAVGPSLLNVNITVENTFFARKDLVLRRTRFSRANRSRLAAAAARRGRLLRRRLRLGVLRGLFAPRRRLQVEESVLAVHRRDDDASDRLRLRARRRRERKPQHVARHRNLLRRGLGLLAGDEVLELRTRNGDDERVSPLFPPPFRVFHAGERSRKSRLERREPGFDLLRGRVAVRRRELPERVRVL